MPAVSEAQRRLAGIALSIKQGETPRSYSKEAADMADSMTEAQLEKFARSVQKKKPFPFEIRSKTVNRINKEIKIKGGLN